MSIISKKHEFVFLPIPKTATTSLDDLFSKEYESSWEPPCQMKHIFIVPDWAKDYFIFTVVRNPYERTFSLWKEMLRADSSMGNFREFIQTYLISGSYRWGKTMHECVGGFNPHILRFENLQEEFSQLPFLKQQHVLPHLNRSHDPQREKLIAENIDLINRWAKIDFDRFGYQMLRPKPLLL